MSKRIEGEKKAVSISNLAKCPKCESEGILEQSSSFRFRVRCSKCGYATKFTNKAQAVADWSSYAISQLEARLKFELERDGRLTNALISLNEQLDRLRKEQA